MTGFKAGEKKLTAPRAVGDILIGAIIALVSIPISMGYTQITGLPAVYGLYGSVLPIFIFALFSSSPQFIFGIDAAPCALVGAFLAEEGIALGTKQAVKTVPVITLVTALCLLIFYIFKADRLIYYVSTPVMGGFISGISSTIILMQIPKLYGADAGTGELVQLVSHIAGTVTESSATAVLLGVSALVLLVVSRRLIPKFPMSVAVMAGGIALEKFAGLSGRGVRMLGDVEKGLPKFILPDLAAVDIPAVLRVSLTVALVIMTETLLASNSVAAKNGYRLQPRREILTYSLANFAAAFTGCTPANGSVSRSSMNTQFGGRTKLVSFTAAAMMCVILLFFTPFIKLMPVPVLTAIVISALLSTIELDLAARLWKSDKKELVSFVGAFLGVLILGTVFGVLIGVIFSFAEVISKTTNPKRSFLGVIPGHEGFHSLERNTNAIPLRNAVIYRFSSNLYFANVSMFTNEITSAVNSDTRAVIVDAGAICSIDLTAATAVAELRNKLEANGTALYFTCQIAELNDRFRALGLNDMIEQGRCRRSIAAALDDAGLGSEGHYELEREPVFAQAESGNLSRPELEWAFGKDADREIELLTERSISSIPSEASPEKIDKDITRTINIWKDLSPTDRVDMLHHLIGHSAEISKKLGMESAKVDEAIAARKIRLILAVNKGGAQSWDAMKKLSEKYEKRLGKNSPERLEQIYIARERAISKLDDADKAIVRRFYGIKKEV